MRWIAPIVLIAGLIALGLSWDSVPESWVIHWGPGGVPNGWATKTPLGALLPFGLGALVWAFLELIATFLQRQGAAYPVLTRGTLSMIRWVGLAIVGATVYTGLALPLMQPDVTTSVSGILAMVAVAVAIGFFEMFRASRASKAAGEELPEGYNAFGYHAPSDERLIVPKVHGLGYTLNFARPMAWVLLAAILLPAAIILGIVFFAAS